VRSTDWFYTGVREGERNSREDDIVPNLMGETHKILYLNTFCHIKVK
jgi:hypothetical protein